MRLKRLELNGFKSFAKNMVLDFPLPISGVVGPNGSGKSNVADAIRWVLGEQSIKSLRGKRGEDMIFAGSATQGRMSRASVVLAFDNSKREFPVEFDEVKLERVVYRDGVNEYLINKSDVRLRDITELLAKVGFGSTRHHIIGQGEADRILYASASERREMVEDALGLKIFHIRKSEAERKLEKTEENIKQVKSLLNEIQPHLKFLKTQAEKFKIAAMLRDDLKNELEDYLARKSATIAVREKDISTRSQKPQADLKKIESEILILRGKIEKEEMGESKGIGRDTGLENKLKKVREEEMASLREMGQLEGSIAAEERATKATAGEFIARRDVEKILNTIAEALDKITVLEMLRDLKKKIFEFLDNLSPKKIEAGDIEAKKKALGELKVKIDKLGKEAKVLTERYEREINKARQEALETRKDEKMVYQLELEAGKLKDMLRGIEFEEEKIKLLKDEHHRELEEGRPYISLHLEKKKPFESNEEMDINRKKIEKLKVRLEEAGGIDSAVLKEFEDISTRGEFLAKELLDLGESKNKLEEMMDELEEKLGSDFKNGIGRINNEFQLFFETMFGGGRASLKIIKREKRKLKEAALEEGEPRPDDSGREEPESGIDINVDLPRKKIRSLDSLSGGERALTSIALLFAMSAVNPPPFLVLDETDAALDEANSQRYAKMLENLSKQTQLILITHNRNTMKCAGILYGVTMGADGISKLLSIKFEEAGALVA